MVELQRISLASSLNISSSLMHMDTKSPQEQQQPPGPQLGPIPAALVSNRLAEVAAVASSPQAVVLVAVQLAVVQAAVAKVQAMGMALAEALATLGHPCLWDAATRGKCRAAGRGQSAGAAGRPGSTSRQLGSSQLWVCVEHASVGASNVHGTVCSSYGVPAHAVCWPDQPSQRCS